MKLNGLWAGLLCFGLSAGAWAQELLVHHQGRLLGPDDAPVEGAVFLEAGLYESAQGGEALWSAAHTVQARGGLFSVTLGSVDEDRGEGAALTAQALEGARWLGLKVNGVAMQPRLALGHAPRAAEALVARSLSGGPVDATQVSVGGVLALDGDGRYVGPTDELNAAFLGGHEASEYLRSVSVGAGLVGEGTASDALRVELPALDEVVEEVQAARGESVALAERLDAMDTARQDAASDAGWARGQIEGALLGGLTSLGGRFGTLETDLSALSGDLTALTSNLSTLTSDHTSLSGEVSGVKTNVSTLTDDLSTLSSNHASLSGEVSGVKTNVSTLTGNLSTLSSNHASLSGEVSGVKTNVATLTGNLSTLSGEVTGARGGATTLKARLDGVDAAIQNGRESLPWSNAHSVTLTDESVDIGTFLTPLLDAYGYVVLTLQANKNYKWNVPVSTRPFQRLVVRGSGWKNRLIDVTTTITMDQNRQAEESEILRRVVNRLSLSDHASFRLEGVNLYEAGNYGGLALTQNPQGMALFVLQGAYSTIHIGQTKIQSSEHIVNISGQAVGHVSTGWVNATKSGLRDYSLVISAQGWSHSGGMAIYSRGSASHTVVESGVSDGCAGTQVLCF